MKPLYVETSGLLRWFAQADPRFSPILDPEWTPYTSTLTLIEAERAFIRIRLLDELAAEEAKHRRNQALRFLDGAFLLDMDEPVVARARLPFPADPVRSLDAIHIATALLAGIHSEGALISNDRRLRAAARHEGFTLIPDRIPEDL